MKAIMTVAFLLGLVSCVDSEDLALTTQQQAETIEVHGCRPGLLTVGDGENTTCMEDPWLGGGGEADGAPADEEPSPGGAGGGGYGTGGPGPKPDRKQCGPEMGEQGCLDCCLYNNRYVDGWECNRKRTNKAREKCWKEANRELSRCQVETCNRHGNPPIITTSVPP
jgi:hypothetical protein